MLGLRHEVSLVQTPRQANVLLVAGSFTDDGVTALRRVHDQMSTPRTTIHWGPTAGDDVFGAMIAADGLDDLVAHITNRHAALLTDADGTEAPWLPDVEANEWRGVGPYGQGGSGMTGGTPYGRPMTGRGPDRDLLQLDALPVTVGPWLPSLPPGLSMRIVFQGDVIHELSVNGPAVPGVRTGTFWDALHRPASIADLELARARQHLTVLAEGLRLLDLAALATRTLRLARHLTPNDAPAIMAIERAIRRTGAFRWSLPVKARFDADDADGLGPIARAAGRVEDARIDDPGYRAIGFEPVIGEAGDVAARWRQRLAEIAQSLALSRLAGDRTAFGNGVVEGPRGRLVHDEPTPSAILVDRLPNLLAGMEWGDAVAFVASLDLDMGEAAATPIKRAEEVAAT